MIVFPFPTNVIVPFSLTAITFGLLLEIVTFPFSAGVFAIVISGTALVIFTVVGLIVTSGFACTFLVIS